eukprot:SAG22_NODE_1595_length_4037_cov_45.725495_2_plen_86_part_00
MHMPSDRGQHEKRRTGVRRVERAGSGGGDQIVCWAATAGGSDCGRVRSDGGGRTARAATAAEMEGGSTRLGLIAATPSVRLVRCR